MQGFNRVMLIGLARRTDDVRHYQDGTPFTHISVTIERTFRTASGETRTERSEVPVFAMGLAGERCAALPTDRAVEVTVEGRLRFEEKRGEGTGGLRHFVHAERVDFAGAPTTVRPVPARAPAQRELLAVGA